MKNKFLANPKFHPGPISGQKESFLRKFWGKGGGVNFIIFGGKGGSGKTTCSCATALYLGQKYKKKF